MAAAYRWLTAKTHAGGAMMTDKIKEQVLAIRDTGLTNMFDIHTVQRIAYDMEFYELVTYLEEQIRPRLQRL